MRSSRSPRRHAWRGRDDKRRGGTLRRLRCRVEADAIGREPAAGRSKRRSDVRTADGPARREFAALLRTLCRLSTTRNLVVSAPVAAGFTSTSPGIPLCMWLPPGYRRPRSAMHWTLMAVVAAAAAVVLTMAAILADKPYELVLGALFALIFVLSSRRLSRAAPQRTRVVGLRPRRTSPQGVGSRRFRITPVAGDGSPGRPCRTDR